MFTKVTHMTVIVNNQDDALRFYTEKLGFKVHTDEMFGGMRWLTINLASDKNFELALMLAETPEDKAVVGKQGGSKPFFNLETDDCRKDYEILSKHGVKFLEGPQEHPWGIGASFEDLYGNVIYMCQTPR